MKKKIFNCEFKQKEKGNKLIKLTNILKKYILDSKLTDLLELLLELKLFLI